MIKIQHVRRAAAFALAAFALLAAPALLKADDTWLPISPDDLALKDNPASPGADAMILYRENLVDASMDNIDGDSDEEYIRIKIFTQAGTTRANVEIPFFRDSMKVKDVEGRTIRPDGSIVKFDGKVLESVITRRSGYKFLAKTFTLPDVQPGCIIEYKYRRQGLPNSLHDMEWIVSQDIFTREARFSMKPYLGYSDYYPFYRPYNLPAGAAMKLEKLGVYTMVVHNVPPIVDEPLMPSPDALESRVEFYYRDSDVATPANEFWSAWAKKLDGEFERFIDKKDVLHVEVSKTVSPNDSPEAKLAKLYARAQEIRNLDAEDAKTRKELKDESIKPNSNVADVLAHGYGRNRDINFLFAGLARAAGFQAEEVRISPINRQIFNPAAEDVRQLGDDLVWVNAGSKDYYLDPAARYFPFNLLPWYEQGALGIRLDKSAPSVTTSQSADSDATIARNAELSIAVDGTISGKLSVDFKGQEAAILRVDNGLEDDDGRKRNLESEIRNWLPTGAAFTVATAGPWDDNSKPLHVEGAVSISGAAAAVGRRLLVPAEIFRSRYSNLFASQQRTNIIDFRYPYREIDDIKFTAPSGYTIAAPPAPQTLNDGAAVYSIAGTKRGDNLEVKRSFAMKSAFFEVKYYSAVRSIFGSVKANDNAQILLQNVQSAVNN